VLSVKELLIDRKNVSIYYKTQTTILLDDIAAIIF